MLRIMTADEPAGTTITVDGELSGDDIKSLEDSCDRAIGSGRPVQLFLREVYTIGEKGRALLSRLASKGVGLKATGLYSSYLVGAIRREGDPKRKQ